MVLGTLFNVKINWGYYFLGLIGIFALFPDTTLYRFVAYAIALHQFMLVFYSFNHVIPVRYLAGSLAAIQYLVGPANAYGGLNDQMYFKYRMQVPEDVYFSYAIPAVILFLIGLHLSGKPTGEVISRAKIERYVVRHPSMPYKLIVIGFLSSVVSGFFPVTFANVFYLLGSFKFIGLFMLLIGTRRVQLWVMVLVIGSIVLSSLSAAMFHDLVTWMFFVLAILAIKYRPSFGMKAGIGLGLLLSLIVLQQVKSVYRSSIVGEGGGNAEQFQESIETYQGSNGGFFDAANIAQTNTRINQGFIVTYAMSHIPAVEPFANGAEMAQVLEAAFLPRIIAPNKLKAGDNDFLYKYTGIALNVGTSMSISALGDGYVNFGVLGGCIFMFFWGFTFNVVLNLLQKMSKRYYMVLIFAPLIYYFPIRPDTALQTGLGHMVKATFLIWLIFQFWGKYFMIPPLAKNKIKQKDAPTPEPIINR